MKCAVCSGKLIEDKGRRHSNGICGPGGRVWVEPSTWHCDDCGLTYVHPPKRAAEAYEREREDPRIRAEAEQTRADHWLKSHNDALERLAAMTKERDEYMSNADAAETVAEQRRERAKEAERSRDTALADLSQAREEIARLKADNLERHRQHGGMHSRALQAEACAEGFEAAIARAVAALHEIEERCSRTEIRYDTDAMRMRDFVTATARRIIADPTATAAVEAWEKSAKRPAEMLLVAEGCHDYGGGHSGAEYEAFHHGIATVVNALRSYLENADTFQIKALIAHAVDARRAGGKDGAG